MTENKTFYGAAPDIVDTEYNLCSFILPIIDDGGIKKGTRLFPGNDTPRHFTSCRLINCELPPGSTTVSCLTILREEHIIESTDTITVDGEVIEQHNYVTRTYGKYDATTEDYIYFTPAQDVIEEQN